MSAADIISYDDLKALMAERGGLLLVDVRTKEEFDKGRIPGSVNIPVDTVESAFTLEPTAFQEKFGVPKPPLDTPELVFHCQLGRRGAAATDKAKSLGYLKARNYFGAYKEWSEKEGK
ncbi:thiosulfate:glutathione sulfurtransferase [Denticeps clupeoides]|uniref:Thiosulfate sulfurtransferase like domain containing 1 n=1 Tax=Denticeps clupeoides TaxID=299321 RepID=A0AAY4E2C3_9TELE|nr:thiosulfate:glutathione sulfurtransferase-like [Denticeps clupeoides]